MSAPGRPRSPRSHGRTVSLRALAVASAVLLAAVGHEVAAVGPGVAAPPGEVEVCTLGPLALAPAPALPLPEDRRHCACTDRIEFLQSTDGGYEAAYAFAPAEASGTYYGAFAERYSTEVGEPGGVCSFVIDLTSAGERLNTAVDLYVWDDLGGRPGAVEGVVTGRPVRTTTVFPFFEREIFDIFDLDQLIAVSGSYWVGFVAEYDSTGCSLHVGADLDGGGGGGSMVYLPDGLGHPPGWNDVSDVFGETAALSIGLQFGKCPVPTLDSTWGRVKSLYH